MGWIGRAGHCSRYSCGCYSYIQQKIAQEDPIARLDVTTVEANHEAYPLRRALLLVQLLLQLLLRSVLFA